MADSRTAQEERRQPCIIEAPHPKISLDNADSSHVPQPHLEGKSASRYTCFV